MINRFITIFLFTIISSFLYANEDVIEKIKTNTASISSIECDFTETKSSQFIETDIVKDGKFYYVAEDKVCLKYKNDDILLMNGDDFIMKIGKDKLSGSRKSNPMISQLGNLLKSCVTGDFTKISGGNIKNLTIETTKNQYILTINMQGSSKKYFSKIELRYNNADYSLEKLKMIEPTEDFTEYTFTNQSFNKQIDLSVFNIH